jgi:HD-GYP domain-containing protein (c-di-GMP phosphodiesterase class II)
MPEAHLREVAELASRIAVELGLTEDAIIRCRLGGWLHDLGKVAIPDRVLTKRAPLDEAEWAIMQTHCEIGERIVRRIPGLAQAAPVVRHHHERLDGAGYPDGLAGEEIPIEARIVAIADAYSALTHDRIFRPAKTHEQALAELQAGAGTAYDQRCVEAFVAVVEQEPRPARSALVR